MEGSEERAARPQYTMAGVMHFLQQEARRYEKDRSEWAVQRALLQTKITQLEGEKIAAQNINSDLLRRIKMLEYALKMERTKYAGDASGSKDSPPVSLKLDSFSLNLPPKTTSALTGRGQKRRQILQRYLSEMSNTDSLIFTKNAPSLQDHLAAEPLPNHLNLNSLPAQDSLKMQKGEIKARLEEQRAREKPKVIDERDRPVEDLDVGDDLGDGTSTVRPKEDRREERPQLSGVFAGGKAPAEPAEESPKKEGSAPAAAAKSAPEAPNGASSSLPTPTPQSGEEGGDMTEEQMQAMASKFGVKAEKLGRMMKGYDKPTKNKKGGGGGAGGDKGERSSVPSITSIDFALPAPKAGSAATSSSATAATPADDSATPSPARTKLAEMDDLKNLSVVDEQDYKPSAENKDAQLALPAKQWKPKSTLRGHLDSVRAVAFRENDNVLLSAAEDGTIKLWNTGNLPTNKKLEPEPFYTFRGHMSMVLSLAVSDSKSGNAVCYSGSADGSIRSWRIPSASLPIYTPFDPDNSGDVIAENLDAVWSLRSHPVKDLLLSVSGNGLVKLWSPETKKAVLTFEKAETAAPTSADFVHTDMRKVVISYSNSRSHVFDLETGKPVTALESAGTSDNSPLTQINQIITHPTLPLAITGHEDKYIRFLDVNTGACINSMVAHLDAVSCLAINPNGLSLVSGGHDSSIRFWDINTHACTQEFTSHRRKYHEGVHGLAFHPTVPILASGGADATVRVYS